MLVHTLSFPTLLIFNEKLLHSIENLLCTGMIKFSTKKYICYYYFVFFFFVRYYDNIFCVVQRSFFFFIVQCSKSSVKSSSRVYSEDNGWSNAWPRESQGYGVSKYFTVQSSKMSRIARIVPTLPGLTFV